MPTEQQDKPHADREKAKRQQLGAVIGKQVLQGLGQPGNLHSVQVRRVWENHYRVNVLIGVDAASTKVAHSYFLVADSEGKVVASTPEITRRY